ncbi:MAG: DUF1918 domain-containing protein [Actinomycetota bacterium]
MPAKRAKPSEPKKRANPAKDATKSLQPASSARSGDVIVVDSEKVGSPPREGEVLEIVASDVRVSYRVRWPDGHESLISPPAGSVRVTPRSG